MGLLLKLATFMAWWTYVSGVSSDVQSGCVTTNLTITYGTAKSAENKLSLSDAQVLVSGLPLQLDQIISMVCAPFSTSASLGHLAILPNVKYVQLVQDVEITMMKNDLYTLEDLKNCIEYAQLGRVFKTDSIGSRFGMINKNKVTDVVFGTYDTRDVCCRKIVCDCGVGTCQNFGSCSDTPNGFVCACRPGFGGKRCEKVVALPEEPKDLSPNKLDRKIDAIILFVCLCLEGVLIAVAAFYYQSRSPRRLGKNQRTSSFDSLQAVDT